MRQLARILSLGLFALQSPGLLRATDELQFQRDVRPILSNHCFKCHGPDAETREADLRLDLRAGLFGTTSDKKRLVAVRNSADSELYRRITCESADERMPPADAKLELNEAEIKTIKRWIDEGAKWQEHWSYRPIVSPDLPPAADSARAMNPIDRFILARLRQENLEPSAPADAATLVRRLSLDLTGLPPDRAEAGSFAADPNEQAYAALIEKLLASPHYGERMAVYWLDLARYADSCGYHSDVDQPISPYRDYVIDAFNENMPFDQFTREQLAGDLLPNPTLRQRVATGFNRLNKATEEGGAQAGEYLAKSAADRVRTTAGVWLASTLGCAECHDHKYDPFTTRDFYSFTAFFADVREQGVWKPGSRAPELAVPSREQQAELAVLDARANALAQELAAQSQSQADERVEVSQQVEATKAAREKLEKSFRRTMVTVSVTPRETRILPCGNWLDSSGSVVEPALPASLLVQEPPASRLTRLDLANWLVSRDNPLTARVFVNRLWKLFFGEGLSSRLDDFGVQGDPPAHAALLDWLAAEFIESGWDIKHMARLIVTSAAYRQSSVPLPGHLERDPRNRLFARQGRWRLEAEFVRDAALKISGLLTRRIGGPSVKPYQPEDYWEFLNFPKRTWKADRGDNQYRRGLYTHWQRTFLHPSLLAFDAPSREECEARRAVSNTPQAALALLNDPTYVESSRMLAARILGEGPAEDRQRIAWVWREATSRAIESEELAAIEELLAGARVEFAGNGPANRKLLSVGFAAADADDPPTELAVWTAVARAILNLNETISRN